MGTICGTLRLEKRGVFTNQVEIKNPSDGSHCKVKLTEGRVVMRMLDGGSSNGPSIRFQAVLPGQPVGESNDEARLIFLLPPFKNDKIQVSFPFIVTCSLTMAVSRRLKNIVGDLIEEYGDWQLRRGKNQARIWLIRQVLGSVGPIMWQIVRYDLRTGVNGWKAWGLPFPK